VPALTCPRTRESRGSAESRTEPETEYRTVLGARFMAPFEATLQEARGAVNGVCLEPRFPRCRLQLREEEKNELANPIQSDAQFEKILAGLRVDEPVVVTDDLSILSAAPRPATEVPAAGKCMRAAVSDGRNAISARQSVRWASSAVEGDGPPLRVSAA